MTAAAEPGSGVAGRVALGAATLIGANVAVRLLSIVNIVVLARLLTPEDYGVVALALVALGFAQQISELQIGNALIRLKVVDRDHYATAFTLTLLRAGIIAAALAGLAGPIAAAMAAPQLEAPLRWVAVVALLDGLASPRMIDFARRLDYRYEGALAVVGRAVSLGVAIAVAFVTHDYWALIVGMLAASVIGVTLTHVLAPWRPRLSLRGWRMFFGFGLWLTAANVVSFANYKADTVLVGSGLGLAALGQFNMGEQMATMATHQIASPIMQSVYAGLAQVGDDPDRLRRAYLKTQGAMLGLMLPLGVGVGLVGRELVLVFAGPQWTDAILVLQVVAPAIAVSMVTTAAHSVLMLRNDTRAIFLRNFVNLLVRVPMIAAGLWLYGVPGVLAAKVLSTLFLIWTTLRVVARALDVPFFAPFLVGRRSFLAVAAMAAAVLALDAGMPAAGTALWPNLQALALKAALGAAVYVGAHAALWRLAGRPDGVERILLDMAGRVADQLARKLRRP